MLPQACLCANIFYFFLFCSTLRAFKKISMGQGASALYIKTCIQNTGLEELPPPPIPLWVMLSNKNSNEIMWHTRTYTHFN